MVQIGFFLGWWVFFGFGSLTRVFSGLVCVVEGVKED